LGALRVAWTTLEHDRAGRAFGRRTQVAGRVDNPRDHEQQSECDAEVIFHRQRQDSHRGKKYDQAFEGVLVHPAVALEIRIAGGGGRLDAIGLSRTSDHHAEYRVFEQRQQRHYSELMKPSRNTVLVSPRM
jgi:hypothetical protein